MASIFFSGYLSLGWGAAGYGNPGASFYEVQNPPHLFYTRQPISFPLASTSVITGIGGPGTFGPSRVPANNESVTRTIITSPGAPWPNQITQKAVWDSPTGGTLLFWWNLASALQMNEDSVEPVGNGALGITITSGLPNGTWTPGAVVGVTRDGQNVIAGSAAQIVNSVVTVA